MASFEIPNSKRDGPHRAQGGGPPCVLWARLGLIWASNYQLLKINNITNLTPIRHPPQTSLSHEPEPHPKAMSHREAVSQTPLIVD